MVNSAFPLTTNSPEATRRLAQALGAACRGGEVILFTGDLGAGKTCFIQGLALGLGIDPATRVTSPTFTLHAQYEGRLILNHLDLYRLDEPVQADALGLSELLDDPGSVLAVEWPELLADSATGECLRLTLCHLGETQREISAAAEGERHRALLDRWRDSRGILDLA